MKEIYVVNNFLGHWYEVSKEEADALLDDGDYGIKFYANWIDAKSMNFNPVKITLIKDGILGSEFATEEDANRLAESYVAYVKSITGMVLTCTKEES